MSSLLHRNLRVEPPVAVRGEDIYIYDADGRRYLDACGGAAVSCLGHSDPDMAEAIREQLGKLAYSHSSFFTTEAAEAAGAALAAHLPRPLEKVLFVSSGSEAVEAAVKIARQYFVEKGEPGRRHIVGRWQSYHGNTLGALSAGGNKGRRALYEPLLNQSEHISACYAYRGRGHNETDDAYGQRVASELDELALQLGPGTIAAFVAETVVGATLGAVPAVPGYFRAIREICDRHGILLLLDEVMCGMGRTGSLFAFEQEGILPDILCIAKGLGAGYQPIAAMVVTQAVHDTIRDGTGAFLHGHTYQAHPVACAAAKVAIDKIARPELIAHVADRGKQLIGGLRQRLAGHRFVGDIRGRGLFVGIEFVADRDTKTPFAAAVGVNRLVKQAAMERGLLCYPMGGTVDGRTGDHVLLAPPFIISAEEIDDIVGTFSGAVEEALQRASSTGGGTARATAGVGRRVVNPA
jgi:adenosylmethionine-8-amino-7-oxononanoate aminotransferase